MNNKLLCSFIGPNNNSIENIITKTAKIEVIKSKLDDRKLILLGTQYSPQSICLQFKYDLGYCIDCLNKGATILIYINCGCHCEEYAELQEQILEDLGYNFKFVNIIEDNRISLIKLYKFAKSTNEKLNTLTFIHSTAKVILSIFLTNKYNLLFQKDDNNKRILLAGDQFSLIQTNNIKYIEEELIKYNIKLYKPINMAYLIIRNRFYRAYMLKKSKKYIKYNIGKFGTESIYYATKSCKAGINGIIYIKSNACPLESNIIFILKKISEDYKTPILFLNSNDNYLNMELKKFCNNITLQRNK